MTLRGPALILGAALCLTSAAAARAQDSLRVEGPARVVIIPEGRSDMAVSVAPASAGGTPQPRPRREGGALVIGPGEKAGASGCMTVGGQTTFLTPRGPVALASLPVVTVRTPTHLRAALGSGVVADIGRSDRLDLEVDGCGAVRLGDVAGPLELTDHGSGEITGAAAGDVRLVMTGSGGVRLGRARGLEARILGSGEAVLGSVSGPVDVRLDGAGGLRINGGEAPDLKVRSSGSGAVRFDGVAGTVEVTTQGSGGVEVARARGAVTKDGEGSGAVRVGR